MRVLGIDPGFDRVGWAVIEMKTGKAVLIGAGCINTKHSKNDRFARYQEIETEITEVLRRAQPGRIGIEQLFAARNVSSVIPVAEARGVLLGCVLRYERQYQSSSVALPAHILELHPSTIKLHVTGNGRADKAAVRKMVFLQLTELTPAQRSALEKHVDDTIDAIAIALTAASLQISV